MTAFKNTIVGRILKGVSKVALPVLGIGAAVLTGGAAAGIISGAGALKGLTKAATGVKKLATSAVNLVTGTSQAERDQVKDVKAEAKAAQDKLDQVERLINAGATRAKAEQMVGVTSVEMGSTDALVKDQEKETKAAQDGTAPVKQMGGCMVTSIILFGSALSGIAALAYLIFS